MARAYDVVIIGAGVMGGSIAFHLARAGAGRVALIERASVCGGNTRKSGALVRMHYTNDPEARLALASLPYFQHWAEIVGGDCGFRQTGFALLVGPDNVGRLERNVARLRAVGVNTHTVSLDELRELQPGLDTSGVAAAAYEPESGYADPVATTIALVARARELGVDLYEQTAVRSIQVSGDRVTGLETSDGRFDAPVVVCAANTWSPALLATAGVALPIGLRRTQTAFFRRPPPADAKLVMIDTTTGLYARPDGAERVLAGVSAHTGQAPRDPDEYDEEVDATFPDLVRDQLGRRLPPLGSAPFDRGQVGLYDMSPDTRAILDRAPTVAGLYIAAGFSGTGFKKAPAVGIGLAELITQGQARTVDLQPFRFARFAEGAPLHGTDEYSLPTDWGHSF